MRRSTSLKCFPILTAVMSMTPAYAAQNEDGIIRATPPADVETRQARFARRDSPKNIKALARRLAALIDLSAPGVAEGFARYYAHEEYAAALDAYRDYVIAKLRDPEQYGIPSLCVRLQEPGSVGTDVQLVQSPADELLRHFESNWRYLACRGLIETGLLFEEFHLSEEMIREGRRGVENAAVLCELPDGSDYELTPNYWGTYLGWVSWPYTELSRALAALERPDALPWMDDLWWDELREHTRLRARAVLAQLMPNGRWPIVAPQDERQQLGEYDRPGIREVIPDFLDAPEVAGRLNLAFPAAAFGDGRAVPPSYASESLPYTGFYFLRQSWDRESPFLFMKSSYHAISTRIPSRRSGPAGREAATRC